MKKCLIPFWVIYVVSCTSTKYYTVVDDYCNLNPQLECYFQILLKRWYDGADGQIQEPVDDQDLLDKIERYKNRLPIPTPLDILKVYENHLQHRGLDIYAAYLPPDGNEWFVSNDEDLNDINMFPIPFCLALRYDIPAQEVLKIHYNIDVNLNDVKIGWNQPMKKCERDKRYILVAVDVPEYEDEHIVFLLSDVTNEVLSIYREKKWQACR
jgi:hypothetical protein